MVGHGAPGKVSVGAGTKSIDCKEINGKDDWKTALKPLKKRFCKNGRILLVGCNVGACDEGRRKLKELADYFGVPVEAPTGKTYGDCGEEEEGSEHQIAFPGAPAPSHKTSPSDKEKRTAKEEGQRMIPDRFIGVQAIAVYPSRFVPPSLENIRYNITGDAVERFLSAIDFNHPINGQLLGAKYNANIYLKFPDSIGEYAVCSDYDYFLKLDRWDNLYDVDYALKQTLRMMVSEFPANSDAIRPGIPI